MHDLGFDNIFLDMTPKSQATKEKVYILDFIKVKNFCASKDTTESKSSQNGKKYLQITYLIKDLYLE